MTGRNGALATRPGERRLAIAFLALIGFYVAILIGAYVQRLWFYDARGYAVPTDFLNVWAAGRMALEGRAAAAFDWDLHRAVEAQAVAPDWELYYSWHYPPTFLLAAAPLALLPYMPALFAWMAVTLPLYAAAFQRILGRSVGALAAFAAPTTFLGFSAGQNGFLTAALMGWTLALLDRRPALAGVALGLLTYKPQYGVLFPLVLALTGRWRVFFSAMATVAVLFVASGVLFGFDAWIAFLNSFDDTAGGVLGEGLAGWSKLQSVFAQVQRFGSGDVLAWALHAPIALAATGATLWAWRRPETPYELQAATLVAAAMLITPYLFLYDHAATTIALAFLAADGLRRGMATWEKAALATLFFAPTLFVLTPLPGGLIMALGVLALSLRRILAAAPAAHPAPAAA